MNKWITLPQNDETTTSSAQTFSTVSSSTFVHGDKLVKTLKRADDTASKEIEKAVYAHVQAIRTLGRTSVTAKEIADALGISVSEAERAMMALSSKGVKVGA